MKIEFLINDGGELYGFKTSDEEKEVEELRIPSIVNGIKVESIADLRSAFWNLYTHGVKKIKKLIIENGIKKIAKCAFAGIGIEISTVCWPKTCLTIPRSCFASSNIKNIIGIEGVEKIRSSAFGGTLLKTFCWPSKCTEIPCNCFNTCRELGTIEGIEQVKKIGEHSFSRTNVKVFSWPSGCRTIPSYCFSMASIEAIEGIENVTRIKSGAFSKSKIKKFLWPSKCKVVPEYCFAACHNLEQIDGLERVTEIKGWAFQGTAIKKFLWPASVSATEMGLFLSGWEHLEEIKFIGTIKDIDFECFSWAENIKKIDLSQLGAVNLINCSSPKGRELRDKVVLPYYATEIN